MTDLTCEFFQRINDYDSSITKPSASDSPPTLITNQNVERCQPHKAEIQQLYAVVQNLDKVTPRATRSPDCLLRGWIEGICGACVPDFVSSNFEKQTSKLLREGLYDPTRRYQHHRARNSECSLHDHNSKKSAQYIEEIKAVIEVIHRAVEDTNKRLERQVAFAQKCREAQTSISWRRLLFFGDSGALADEELSLRDQQDHIRGMAEILNSFLTDLRDLIKLHEISLLKAEVTEQEILSGWFNYKSCLEARKDNEIEAAAHYAAAVNAFTRRLEGYLINSTKLLTSDFSPSPKDESGSGYSEQWSSVASLSPRSPSGPRSLLDTSDPSARPNRSGRIEEDVDRNVNRRADLPPEEIELIAQANPKIQQLHCLQERDNLEEESVIEITRKVERISELLSVLATEVDNQHSISSNILVVTNAAIANVGSAQSELEKAMQRKISWRRVLFLVYLASGVLLIMIDLLKGGGF